MSQPRLWSTRPGGRSLITLSFELHLAERPYRHDRRRVGHHHNALLLLLAVLARGGGRNALILMPIRCAKPRRRRAPRSAAFGSILIWAWVCQTSSACSLSSQLRRSSMSMGSPILSSAQAAEALRPIAGEFTFAVFAACIIGIGLLAVPMLAGSAAYALGEALGRTTGLDQQPLKAKAC
jgi:hypothetical protein